MSTAAALVAEFHRFFGQPVRHKLTRLTQEEIDFRLALIAEEHDELAAEFEHWEDYDARRAYKELADLIYVAYGMDAFMGGYLDRAVEAVHESNMTKLWDCDKCEGTGYDAGRKVGCSKCDGDGKLVMLREDGKVLKPPTYTPADLSFIKENE